MRASTEIGLADLLRAFDALKPDDTVAVHIARCLGYAATDPNPVEAVQGVSQERETRGDRVPDTAGGPVPEPPRPTLIPSPPLPDATKRRRVHLTRVQSTETAHERTPGIPLDVRSAPAPPARRARALRQTLFQGRTAPRLLTAAMSTRRSGPELDIEATLRIVLSGRSLRTLPRRPVPTMERGVQLLLDRSDSMMPFRCDLNDLAAQLEAVAGRLQVATYTFDRNPASAATGRWPSAARWYPRQGTPVLVATDFGRSIPDRTWSPGLLRVWDRFLARCAEADAPVVVLDPLGPDFWPGRLSRRMTLIHWSPQTRATAIRHQIGAGHVLRETRDPPAPAHLVEALQLRPRKPGRPTAAPGSLRSRPSDDDERGGEAGD